MKGTAPWRVVGTSYSLVIILSNATSSGNRWIVLRVAIRLRLATGFIGIVLSGAVFSMTPNDRRRIGRILSSLLPDGSRVETTRAVGIREADKFHAGKYAILGALNREIHGKNGAVKSHS